MSVDFCGERRPVCSLQKLVLVPRNRAHGGSKVRIRQMDARNGQWIGKVRPAPAAAVSGVELKRQKI